MTEGILPNGDGDVLPVGRPYSYVSILHSAGIGHIALASKDRNGRFHQRLLEFLPCLGAVSGLDEQRDWYLSPNAFRAGDRRRKADVISVRASWVDLDFYKTELANLTAEQVWGRAVAILTTREIPMPQIVVSTGRGLQLVWIYPKGLPAQIEPRWTAVQRSLIETFAGFGPDPTANSMCGVLRIPGTINTKSGMRAYVVYLDWDGRTSFDDLARAIAPLTRPKELISQGALSRKPGPARGSLLRSAANQSAAAVVVQDIERLVRGRGIRHEPKSSQDLTFFIYGHYLRRAVCRDLFWQKFMRFADEMTTCNAREKRETAKSVLSFTGRFSTVGAASRLGVTSEEVETYQLQRLLPSGVENDRRKFERRIERGRQQKARARRAKGQQLQTHSLEAKKPWKSLEISRATYYRHVKGHQPSE